MTVQCCKCKRIREEAQWSAPVAVLLQGEVSHTYCPTCADECHIELFSTQASRATAVQASALLHVLSGVA